MKIVDNCESNKQMGLICVSRIRMKPCKPQGSLQPAPREALIQTQVKISVKERRLKTPVSNKCPLKTVAPAARRSKKVQNESDANLSAMGLAESIKWV